MLKGINIEIKTTYKLQKESFIKLLESILINHTMSRTLRGNAIIQQLHSNDQRQVALRVYSFDDTCDAYNWAKNLYDNIYKPHSTTIKSFFNKLNVAFESYKDKTVNLVAQESYRREQHEGNITKIADTLFGNADSQGKKQFEETYS